EQMDGVEEKRDGGPEPEAERRDPEESDGLLQRRPPVVPPLVPEADCAQVIGGLDHVVDVHGDAEPVSQRGFPPLQAQPLDAERGGEKMSEDRHAVGLTGALVMELPPGVRWRVRARSPSPKPIQRMSRARLTMAV